MKVEVRDSTGLLPGAAVRVYDELPGIDREFVDDRDHVVNLKTTSEPPQESSNEGKRNRPRHLLTDVRGLATFPDLRRDHRYWIVVTFPGLGRVIEDTVCGDVQETLLVVLPQLANGPVPAPGDATPPGRP
jgi:hypothetical protein